MKIFRTGHFHNYFEKTLITSTGPKIVNEITLENRKTFFTENLKEKQTLIGSFFYFLRKSHSADKNLN